MLRRKKICLFLLYILLLNFNLKADGINMENKVLVALNKGIKATEVFLEKVPIYYIYEYDKTILHYAVELNKYKMVDFLVSKNIELNRQGGIYYETALQDAIFYEYFRIAILLVNSGTDLDIQNVDGDTALHIAARYGYSDMITLLIKNGASKNILNLKGNTAYNLLSNFSSADTKSLKNLLKPDEIVEDKNRKRIGTTVFPLDTLDYGQARFTLDQMNFDTGQIGNSRSTQNKSIQIIIVDEDTETANSKIGNVINSN